MNRSDIRMREYLCRRLSAARRRQKYEPGLTLLGKDIIVTDMHAHITAFEVKLRLWDAQLANGQLEHFTRLAACVPDDVEPDTCVSVVSLREEFASLSQESGR